MKRSLLIGALSALVLAFFALPVAADPVVPPEGEAQPMILEDDSPPVIPTTPYDACVVEALDPVVCGGVPDMPPLDGCSSEGDCEIVGAVPDQEIAQAAMMAAEEAAADAVADTAAEEGSDVVDSTAAYLAALGAAREAGATEESTPIAAGRAVGALSNEALESEEAGKSEDGTGASKGRASSGKAPAAKDETSPDENAAPTDDESPSGRSATSTESEASPTEKEVSVEDVATVLPVADGASILVLVAGALLVAAGIVGLLIRRRLALREPHQPEQAGDADASEAALQQQRLPQRSIR